jgi:NTE family protein
MQLDPARWEELPRPVGFVLSGGATLGALQVGMLRALAAAGIRPDLVAGTSVGALNGAVLADVGLAGPAAHVLDATWRAMSTATVFPGGRLRQAWRLARRRSVYPDTGLRHIISSSLGPDPTFEGLSLPFAAVATDVLGGFPAAFARGDLTGPLLASTAIPGLLPTQVVDGRPCWDGGVTANVPLRAALALGARSLVVLDAGDICQRTIAPDGGAASTLAAMSTAIRQRVLIEVAQVAEETPVLYLARPCVTGRAPLSFTSTPALLRDGEATAAAFLLDAPVPVPGTLVGEPHSHRVDDPSHGEDHAPMFVRGMPNDRRAHGS